MNRRIVKEGITFEHDYQNDLQSYLGAISRLIGDWELRIKGPDEVQLNPTPALILRDVVAPVLRTLDPHFRQHNFSHENIHCSGFEEIPMLFVDVSLLRQTFFNLLDNAIKYARPPRKNFTVNITANSITEDYQIKVADNGIGINHEDREKIFNRGYRGRPAANMTMGTGLGMFVSRGILRKHGGDLTVTSTINPTEITILLPKSLAHTVPNERVK